MDLECDICTERFDGAERLPKVLPCGHTACLQCLRRLSDRSCPTCRRDFNGPPEGLPTNFLALKSLEGVKLDSTPRCWEDHDVAAAPPPAAATLAARGPPPADAPPPREMNVINISQSEPDYMQQEKAAALRDAPGVTRLVYVYCRNDPAWTLELLQRAAPTLERLDVRSPREAHLTVVHAMPRLRRLYVVVGDAALFAQPPELPALPPGRGGLQYLRVYNLPRATTQSLLRAHGRTLEELQLGVGTAAGSEAWPESCGDLHSLLQQSGLRALRRLVLRRWIYSHGLAACSEQCAEVRRVLPGAEVLCDTCAGVELEEV